jgi:catechol 2,3-dioxygenase-like lactoylglutathione lyase family enzyme
MDHAGVVVDDLAAATAFFVELGLKLQGEGTADGDRASE